MNKLILQVEDEESDILFMQMAMEAAGVKNPVSVARDGQEALDYLKGEGKFVNREQHPLPDLVLLDLRLPYVPGLEVLQWIRQQPAFKRLPILVFSSSNQDTDVEAAYRLGADGYVMKPSGLTDLEGIVRVFKRYWLDVNGPPPNCPEWEAVVIHPLAQTRQA